MDYVPAEEERKKLTSRTTRSIRNANGFFTAWMCLFTATAFAFAVVIARQKGLPEKTIPYPLLACLTGEVFAGILVWERSNRKAGRESKRFAETAKIEQLPTLLEAMSFPCQDHVELLRTKITELLPLVREEHAELFKSQHRRILRTNYLVSTLNAEVMSPHPKVWFTAVFQALPYIGTQEELDWVKGILEQKNVNPELKEMAYQCLPALEARVVRLSNRNTLLRASSAEAHPPETLLRPAPATQDPAELLLRPENHD